MTLDEALSALDAARQKIAELEHALTVLDSFRPPEPKEHPSIRQVMAAQKAQAEAEIRARDLEAKLYFAKQALQDGDDPKYKARIARY